MGPRPGIQRALHDLPMMRATAPFALLLLHTLSESQAPFVDGLECHDQPILDIGVISVIGAAGFRRGPRLSAPAGGAILAG